MKAQIFYLKSQEDLCGEIEPLLRRYVFQDIQVERRAISDTYYNPYGFTDPEWEHCRLYHHLLKACMIKVDDFGIVVADGQGRFSYIEAYEGYAPGLGYWRYKRNFLTIFHKSMTSAFPAVALMDRMIIVPQRIHEAFEKSRDFSWFLKPLDLEGVLLVDFQDSESVREAIREAGARLKAEIVKLCRRHMLVRKNPSPDFTDLANLLNIDKKLLEELQNEILASSAKLTARIVSGPAKLEKLSRVVLEIQNETGNVLDGIRVQVRAPSGTLKVPVAEILNFSGGDAGTRRIQFEVLPKASPYCPLEVLFSLSETNQTCTPFPIPVILDVSG